MKWKPSESWKMYWCSRSSTKARSGVGEGNGNDSEPSPILERQRPCRAPAVPDRARSHRQGVAGAFCRNRFRRGGNLRAAGLAGQRNAHSCFRDPADLARGPAHAPLLAHLTGIRLQKTVGRRRAPDRRVRPRLPQPRALAAASSRIHADRVVSGARSLDRKSTRLNSSHTVISYAVFCLKKKKKTH